MRAVVYEQYGEPEVLHTITMEKPIPTESQVLVKVGGSSINPVDTYFRKGIRQVPSFPHIPHFDLGGTIVDVGSKVHKFKIGDRVWGTNISGTCTEYLVADEKLLFPLPSHITEIEGAALAMPFMTAHLSLHYRGNIKKKETVLVYGGAGAVGNAAIQLAKQAGATVITTASNKQKADLCRRAGADFVILYKDVDLLSEVESITKGTGVDLILEMSLSENMDKDLEMIKVGGKIITIGSPKNNSPSLPWRLLNQKHASLVGVLLFTAPEFELRKAGDEISELLEHHAISALVGATFPFDKASEAHQALEKHLVSGSIVLVP